jgi:hypothetical protein
MPRLGPVSRVIIGFVVLTVLIICAMVPAVRQAREAALLNACHCRMCGMSMTLARYYEANGTYPPEYSRGADGKRTRWKQILEESGKVEFDLSCPTKTAAFAAVCGPGAILDGPEAAAPDDVADGCDNTLILIEFTLSELAHAGSPDVRLDELSKMADSDGMFSATSIHPGGRGLVFADCVNFRLLKPISVRTMRALLTRAGGENVTRQQLVDDGYVVHRGWYAQIP